MPQSEPESAPRIGSQVCQLCCAHCSHWAALLIPDTFSFRKNFLQVTTQSLLVAVGSDRGHKHDRDGFSVPRTQPPAQLTNARALSSQTPSAAIIKSTL